MSCKVRLDADYQIGVTPAYYRWLARRLISDYKSVTMTNGTVTGIQAGSSNVTSFTVQATLPSGEKTLTARKVVLGTGLKDDLPGTPGLQENWGKGIYWCPWCDGNEHADQALGLLGPLEDIPGLVREVATLNSEVAAFANGTDTPEARAATEASFPDWEEYLKISNVTVYNQTITSITRLKDGHNPDADPSLATSPEYDLFRVDLDDGTSVERAAFFVSFPDEQKSNIGADLGVTLYGGRLYANQDKGLITNIPGAYAIGDANSDNVTNVPHAIYTGKKAAVYAHGESSLSTSCLPPPCDSLPLFIKANQPPVQLAREDVAAELAAARNNDTAAAEKRQEFALDPRDIWERMNGHPGDLLYAGEF